MFDEVRKELEELGWPNGRAMKGNPELKKRIEEATSFLDPSKLKSPAQRLFCLYANIQHTPACPECGNDCTYNGAKMYEDNIYGGWSSYCSKKCALESENVKEKYKQTNLERHGSEHPMHSEKIKDRMKQTVLSRYGVDHYSKTDEFNTKTKQTSMERYGVEHHMHLDESKEKIKKTNLERYGVDHPMYSEEIKDKIKKTNLERYGVKNTFQAEEFKKKGKQTLLERYGFEHALQVDEFKEKATKTTMKRYGVDNAFQSKEIKEKIKKTNMERYGVESHTTKHISPENMANLRDPKWMEEKYNELGGVRLGNLLGVYDVTVYRYLRKHNIPINPNVGTSFGERQVASFIESLGFDIITSDRSILGGGELDIYIPSKNIAIEHNGIFWHSDRFKERNYHLEKTNLCSEKGVRLLHLFEDEWVERQDQVKAKIKSILGVDDRERVFARKCRVVVLENSDVRDFYEENHIQGHINATIVLGLKNNDDLVAVMSFKHTRGYMELVRYATSRRVIGGFSKIIKALWRLNPGIDSLVSFADKRWSQGDVYLNNGWMHVGTVKPNYYYVKGQYRFLKQGFRKEKFKTKHPEVYDPSKTERQMAEEAGYLRIYDCGLMKFEIKNPHTENDKGAL